MHVVRRTAVLVVALALGPSLAAAKQPPVGTATFSEPSIGQVAITGWAVGLTAPTSDTSGGGGGAGKVTFSDFAITKAVDAASPALIALAAAGRHVQSVVIAITNGDTAVLYRLDDVVVTSLRQVGAAEATESLTVAYRKIMITVGQSTATWDLATNTSG